MNILSPRLVNRFKLGCDPEYVFSNGRFVPAEECDLHVGRAFGCDGSGGPVELRAHPSRFAVGVVASLLNTMRLLAASNETARTCAWIAGGYNHRHPAGGHI